ncbi:hypothetical protein [Microbacterium sp. CJ88]|uniref:hypothetical protein n=1 Tax=Microbacterium sp. CJ88 TaxID=3445672 RepID=UPI003F65FDE9
MTEPEQPEQPQLTRKQMRQIRNTAANPIIVPSAEDRPAEPDDAVNTVPAPSSDSEPVIDAPESAEADPHLADASAEVAASPAPLPRAAAPIDMAPPPISDASVDLGVSPLTRRQARQQERIRTASVPVITPDVMAAHTAAAEPAALVEEVPADLVDEVPSHSDETIAESATDAAPEADTTVDSDSPEPDRTASDETDDLVRDLEAATDEPATDEAAGDGSADERATLAPSFGSGLLAGDPVLVTPPPSFDQLLARGTSTSGSGTASNALILSQTPEGALIGPVAATGEVLVTGTFALPDGLGSQGHAPGTADGREVDAVLVDGELPAHSSPTPIAASAAISTVKSTGEIIRPPAPEKGSRLMLTLAITAGVLALALVGVLILAFATGVFA